MFAAIESALSNTAAAVFANAYLLCSGGAFVATLDRVLDAVGEYNLTADRRDQLTLPRALADSLGFVEGLAIELDPLRYTAAELTARPRAAWVLDRLADDDGYLVTWWLR